MENTLYNLYYKYERSGINGAPVITDREMILLREKLKETEEFLNRVNVARFGVVMSISSIELVLRARDVNF